MGGLRHRRGGAGLHVTVSSTASSVDVHRPRSVRESLRASPYGRGGSSPRERSKLAPLLTPGTQLSGAIGGLALAPIPARTRLTSKPAWGHQPPAAQPPTFRQTRLSTHNAQIGSRSDLDAYLQSRRGSELDAYLQLHGFTTERTPPAEINLAGA